VLDPTRGALRVARASAFGGSGFVLTLVAHVAAGGAVPGPAALVLLGLCTALLCVALTGRRLGRLSSCGVLALTEGGLHAAFMWLSRPGSGLPSLVVPSGPHAAHAVLTAQTSGMPGMHMGSDAAGAPAGCMLAAHALVSLALALLLARGERVVWLIADLFRPALRLCLLPQVPVSWRAPAPALAAEPKHLLLDCGGLGRRGPPPLWLCVLCS
jgi:hypothetical protein